MTPNTIRTQILHILFLQYNKPIISNISPQTRDGMNIKSLPNKNWKPSTWNCRTANCSYQTCWIAYKLSKTSCQIVRNMLPNYRNTKAKSKHIFSLICITRSRGKKKTKQNQDELPKTNCHIPESQSKPK